ncbi:MAG: accessory factor UbiK family protein [Blastomonas sp.]
MQNKSDFAKDFAKFMNGLAGTIAGASREAGETARERTREWFGGMDFVSREEFEAVKEMAAKAREEAEDLKARVEALEKAAKPAARKPAARKPSTGKAGGKSA